MTQDHWDHGALRELMNDSILGMDLSLPSMQTTCDTSHLGSLILIWVIPMERIIILIITMFLSMYKYMTKHNNEE